MTDKEIRSFIFEYLHDRLEALGIAKSELKGDFDFVQSGLMDSMAFVDMVTDMEKHFKVEIDFENEVEDSSFTNVSRLIDIFVNKKK